MADLSYSILIDAHQAQNAAQRLEASLKRVDSATYSLTKSLGKAKDVMKRDLASAMTMVAEANTLLKTSFSEFGPKVTAAGNDISAMSKRIAAASKDAKTAYSNFKDSISESDAAFKKAEKAGDAYLAQLQKLSSASRVTSKDLQKLESLRRGWESSKGTALSSSPTLNAAYSQYQKSATASHASLQKELRNTNELIKLLEADHAKAASRYKKTEKAIGDLSVVLFTLRQQYDSIKAADRDLSLGQKIAKAEKEYNNLSKTLDTTAKNVANLAGKLQMARQTRDDLNQRIAVSNNYMRLGSEAVSVHAARLKGLNDVTTQTTNSLDQLNARLASNKQNTLRTSAESKADRLQALQNSSFLNPFRDITADSVDTVSAFGMITKSARNALYAVNAVRIAINLAFAASGIGAGVRVLADYDQTLADLSSTIRPTGKDTAEFRYQMEALKNTMEELGATSRFTTAEAGKGMIYMAQSGLEAGEVVSASKNVIDLAVASNTSLERSSDIVVQAMRTFDIAASEAWRVTDTLAAGAKNSVTSIEQLANALHYVGPVAHTLGIQINTTVAALGTLSDSGLQASMAGTGLRRVISEIVNPTGKARKIFEAAGLTIDKLNIRSHGLVKVLENIKEANLSVGDSFAIWGDRGTPAFQTLMTNFDKFKEKLNELKFDKVFGTASEMREEREKTLPGQAKALSSAIQDFAIKSSQYTGFTSGLTSVLEYLAKSLREMNLEIHNVLSSMAAWGTMIGTIIISQKMMNGGTKALSSGINSYTRDIRVAARAYLLFSKSQQDAVAGAGLFSRAIITTKTHLAQWIKVSKTAAVVARTLSAAWSTLWSLGMSAVIGAGVGLLTKYVTSADEAEIAIERLQKFSDAFWEKTAKKGDAATKFLDSYGIGLRNLSKEAFNTAKAQAEGQKQILESAMLDPNKTRLKGDNWFRPSWNESNDLGRILFGKSSLEMSKLTLSELTAELNRFHEAERAAEATGGSFWKSFNKETETKGKEYIKLLDARVANSEQLLEYQKESERRDKAEPIESFMKTFGLKNKDFTEAMQANFQAFSGVMAGIDTASIENTIKSMTKKYNELMVPTASEEAQEFWKAFMGAGDIANVEQYFDVNMQTFTIKLKDSVQKLYDEATKKAEESKKAFIEHLMTTKGLNLEEATKEADANAEILKTRYLQDLGIDRVRLEQVLSRGNESGEIFKRLQEKRREVSLKNFFKSSESENSLIAVGNQAQTAKDKLLELYSIDQLAPFEIQFTDTMATVVAAEGAVTAETQAMQTQIETSLTAIYTALGKFSTAKFKTYAANQKVLSGLDKNTRKHVEGFSRQTGLSPELYDKSTGMWKGTPELPQEEINPLFQTYVAEHTNKTANAMQKLKHEQDELRLKYRQYVAEVKSGSSAEIELAKLQLEKTKERNTVLEMASRAGLTAKDEEIAKTLKLVEATWKLKEAEAQRKFEEEKRTAPLQLSVTSVQATGLSAYPQQIALAKQQLTDLEAQLGGVTSGSQKWYEIMGQINQKGWEVYNLSSQQKQESLNIAIEYEKSRGNFSKMYELEVQLLGVEIQRLEAAKLQTDLTEEQKENIQKQIDTLKLKQESANKNDPVAGAKDAILAMSESMSTYQLFNDVVTNSVGTLTNSLVSFFETGKFEASQFAAELGKMILDLTTKMLIVQSLKAMIFGNGGAVEIAALANGGMKNVTAYANGGVEQLNNVRKFATGGLLTSPTFFNTTSGTALAGEAGYEHIMPAARLSNGKWGVYAEGMGGNNNQFVINTNINVEGGSSGNAEDDNKLAATISEKVSQSIKDTVKAELVQQMRAGGLLNSNGNKRW